MKKAFLLTTLIASSASAAVTPAIRVGLIIPETRQDHATVNPWGVRERQGFELALDGAKFVKWEIRDNSESAIIAKEKAAELLRSGVDLIAGLSFSDQAMAVKQQTDAAGVPFLTVFATSENLFNRNKAVFTMAVSDESQAAALVAYAAGFRDLKKTGVGFVVARNCEYCVDMEKSIKASLAAQGIPFTQYPDILKNRPVPHDYFDKIAPSRFLFVLAYEVEGLSVVNTLAQKGYKGILMGGDSWSTQTMQVARNLGLLKSMCLANPVPYDVNGGSAANQRFRREYLLRYGEQPTDVAALAYDAGTAVVRASERCRSADNKKHCVADAIAGLHFDGVSGKVKFSENGKRLALGVLLKSSSCASLERDYGFRE